MTDRSVPPTGGDSYRSHRNGSAFIRRASTFPLLREITERVTSWRFRRYTRHFDAAIANAQRRHMPTNHIRQAKTDFIHDALRRAVGQ